MPAKNEQTHELGMTKKKADDLMEWYYEVLQKADVVDIRYKIKGFDVYMPTAVLVIEEMFRLLESELRATGHLPLKFPILIPESEFKKEAEHIKGFMEEVFWITHAGKNKLDERLILRPTSETAMYPMYSLWLRSHQQLPLKFYQTGTVYRYETKMTRPLLRPREFLWMEAHDVQKDKEGSIMQVGEDMDIFKKLVTDGLCIPFLLLKRTEWDKFPGADDTYAFETVMPDGNILQIGTTHDLGQNFSKVFDISFLDENGKKQFAHQTTFGAGISRTFGAVIGMHGDDKGLVLPPSVAPIQVVIVPIHNNDNRAQVFAKCEEVLGRLQHKGFRTHFDSRDQYSPGFKFNEWELKGVPVRVEIGPRDIAKNEVSVVRRDSLDRNSVSEQKLDEHLREAMGSMAVKMLKRANDGMIVQDAGDFKGLQEKLKKRGFVRVPFCMQERCNEQLKEKTGAEVRGTLFGDKAKPAKGAKCAICGAPAKEFAYAASSY